MGARAGPRPRGTPWNGRLALARTVKSGKQLLHLAYATNRIEGRWATDRGPKVGVYYIRSSSGSAWTSPRPLKPTSEHATSLGLAASGSRVHAIWVSQPSAIWPTAGTRYIMWNGWTANINAYRLYIRRGTGTTVGPWQSAGAWSPAAPMTTVIDPDR